MPTIGRTVSKHHDLRVYDIMLLKPNSILKTTSGKIKRHECRKLYLSNNLNVWAE